MQEAIDYRAQDSISSAVHEAISSDDSESPDYEPERPRVRNRHHRWYSAIEQYSLLGTDSSGESSFSSALFLKTHHINPYL